MCCRPPLELGDRGDLNSSAFFDRAHPDDKWLGRPVSSPPRDSSVPIVIMSLVYLYCILTPPLSWPGTLGATASHTAGALVTAPVEPGLEGSVVGPFLSPFEWPFRWSLVLKIV